MAARLKPAIAVGISVLTLASAALLADGAESEPTISRALERGSPSALSTAAGGSLQATASGRRSRKRKLWGAWIGSQLTGTEAPFDMRAVRKFERIAGKRLSIVHWASPFANCASRPCSFYTFPTREMAKVRRHGAIPMLSWSSASIPAGKNQRAFQLRDVAGGRYDRYIRRFARAAKRWGHPFFLRFNWEMNGNWFPWAVRANRNRPRHYRAAWRHVHRIFGRVGARKATWVWCPYVDPERNSSFRKLYPGRRFVDWTCLDGYNWGPGSPANPRPWRSFGRLFRSSYRRIVRQVARRKPMIIAEVASSDYGGSKAGWIRNMLSKLPRRYPKVRGFVWFNVDDRGAGWPIESSRRVRRVFRRGINRRVYVPNRFGRIRRGPIRPPGRR
jgi:hypothetical protein